MNEVLEKLVAAEKLAWQLFDVAEERKFFTAGQTEKDLNNRLYELAFELFGIKKYWHKRIVRSGKNTLLPYSKNPANLTIQPDDILFVDFGPLFDKWEADIGKTYAIGTNTQKHKLAADVETIWNLGHQYYTANMATITGAELYAYTEKLAAEHGWKLGNSMAGHLIGRFPHKKIEGGKELNYIHPDNHLPMSTPYANGNPRFWIYEVHLVDPVNEFGGFYEKVLY